MVPAKVEFFDHGRNRIVCQMIALTADRMSEPAPCAAGAGAPCIQMRRTAVTGVLNPALLRHVRSKDR
jgi:hypothetical protein